MAHGSLKVSCEMKYTLPSRKELVTFQACRYRGLHALSYRRLQHLYGSGE
jgi:hypothetical protein